MDPDPANSPLPLEPATGQVLPANDDTRPQLPIPPPVRVICVEDVTLTALAEHGPAIDHLMTVVLPLIKEIDPDPAILGRYVAENARVIYRLRTDNPPHPRHVLLLELADLRQLRLKLQEAEIDYELVKRLTPGDVRVALLDAAGNPIEVLQNSTVL